MPENGAKIRKLGKIDKKQATQRLKGLKDKPSKRNNKPLQNRLIRRKGKHQH